MDPGIENLKSTTFFGRRLTRRQIADVQETVALFPALSRNELAKTICEHLNWTTPKGDYRVSACLRMLESLEECGILSLPAKRNTASGPRRAIEHTERSDRGRRSPAAWPIWSRCRCIWRRRRERSPSGTNWLTDTTGLAAPVRSDRTCAGSFSTAKGAALAACCSKRRQGRCLPAMRGSDGARRSATGGCILRSRTAGSSFFRRYVHNPHLTTSLKTWMFLVRTRCQRTLPQLCGPNAGPADSLFRHDSLPVADRIRKQRHHSRRSP